VAKFLIQRDVWEKVTEAFVLKQNVGGEITHHGVNHCKYYAHKAEHVFFDSFSMVFAVHN